MDPALGATGALALAVAALWRMVARSIEECRRERQACLDARDRDARARGHMAAELAELRGRLAHLERRG